jgi:hypothetical protein
MKQSNLCQNFAGWTKKVFLTGRTLIRPFTSKEVMNISLGVSVLFGYEGLKWVRYIHVDHSSIIPLRIKRVKLLGAIMYIWHQQRE